jgi:guanylate kinase
MGRLENGFLVCLCGSACSGKSFLMYKLLEDFDFFKPISFEKHLIRNDILKSYSTYYRDIHESLKKSNVICESIYAYNNNKWTTYSPNNAIIILCEPSYEEHRTRVSDFKEKYGLKQYESRFGNLSLDKQRKNARADLRNYILYTGKEYDFVKKEINKHVFNAR